MPCRPVDARSLHSTIHSHYLTVAPPSKLMKFQSCPGLTVILVLDDERARVSSTTNDSSVGGRGRGGGRGGRRRNSSPQPRKRPHSSESGIFRDVRIRRGDGRRSRGGGDAAESSGQGAGGGNTSASVSDEGGAVPRCPSMVDFSVVDYVLRKPFSDETFRRVLEAVEADHLQVRSTSTEKYLRSNRHCWKSSENPARPSFPCFSTDIPRVCFLYRNEKRNDERGFSADPQ